MFVSSTALNEIFVWKHSGGRQVRALGASHGLKLVKKSTGEVLAAYGEFGKAPGKLGHFTWISEEVLSDEAALLFLISLVALVEMKRRGNEPETNA